MEHYDVIVIGGGTMGTAAAWALAKRGVRALVIEQFGHVHSLGSHSGKTRIIRHAYAESPDYVPLVARAEELWLRLQDEQGTQLHVPTGGLDLARPGFRWAQSAREAAIVHHLPYEWLDGAEIRRRWPAWTIDDAWEACYSPQTGFLLVEPALRALAAGRAVDGAVIQVNEPVRGWRRERRASSSKRLGNATPRIPVVTAGAWAGHLLAELNLPLTVLRKTVWWLAVDDPAPFAVGRFPIFISESAAGSIYGFPIADGSAIKIANHSGGERDRSGSVDRVAHDAEVAAIFPFASTELRGITTEIVDRAVCLYTMTPGRDFVIDRHPVDARVVIAAGFSGHGFKFAPAVGELLADLALDPEAKPWPRFAIDRFLHQ